MQEAEVNRGLWLQGRAREHMGYEGQSERPGSEACIPGCVTLSKSLSVQSLSFHKCKMGTVVQTAPSGSNQGGKAAGRVPA